MTAIIPMYNTFMLRIVTSTAVSRAQQDNKLFVFFLSLISPITFLYFNSDIHREPSIKQDVRAGHKYDFQQICKHRFTTPHSGRLSNPGGGGQDLVIYMSSKSFFSRLIRVSDIS